MAGAQEFRAFEVTCPPGTSPGAVQTTDLDMPVREVLEIRVRIPPGPLGSMGFGLGAAGTVIVPYDSAPLIVADDETFVWDLRDQFNSGAWQVFTYNTGQYPHTIYLYFTVELPDAQTAPAVSTPLPAESLGPPAATVPIVNSAPALPPLVLAP